MKKTLLLTVALIGTGLISTAQTSLVKSNSLRVEKSKQVSVKMQKTMLTGFEIDQNQKAAIPVSASSRALGYSIGVTDYDLGSNGAVKPRLINFGNKKLSGAFNYGTGDISTNVPNRGSGYNTTDANGKFGKLPTKRVESVRTGFTNLCADADGNEYLFAHKAVTNYAILMSKKLKGATTWTESDVPSNIAAGVLWSSAAIGGANGKTIHLIAISAPVSLTGTTIDDIDGCLLYYRSTDGGATWDKTDIRLPGIEGTRYNRMSADAYSITAKGDKVVVASYGDFYDTEIWTSTDNGENFTRKTILDFPIPNYKLDDLYETKDIPNDPNAPDSLAILSGDGSGIVFIDNNNKTHLLVGSMYYVDDAVDAGAFNYFPGTNGIFHWDENTPDSLYEIDAYPDLDGDGTINLDGFGTYYNCLTSYPNLVQGADNVLYLVYTAPSEDFLNGDKMMNCRHVFIMNSKDGGKNWSKPYDVLTDKTLFDDNEYLLDLAECSFPYTALNVDNSLHVVYQLDYTPGMHVSHPSTQTIDVEENYQVYTDIPTARITKAKDAIAAEQVKFEIFPNPAKDIVNLTYVNKQEGNVKVTISDLTGRVIQKNDLGLQNAGNQQFNLPIQLNPGVYFIQLEMNNAIATQKLIVR